MEMNSCCIQLGTAEISLEVGVLVRISTLCFVPVVSLVLVAFVASLGGHGNILFLWGYVAWSPGSFVG
jgi:hypothetical protein